MNISVFREKQCSQAAKSKQTKSEGLQVIPSGSPIRTVETFIQKFPGKQRVSVTIFHVSNYLPEA